jgi:signal transduction histidine kinase
VFERGVSDGGGTGVGLYLCKTVVESHGGEIWIDSEPGKGAAVCFTLPVYEGQYGGGAA